MPADYGGDQPTMAELSGEFIYMSRLIFYNMIIKTFIIKPLYLSTKQNLGTKSLKNGETGSWPKKIGPSTKNFVPGQLSMKTSYLDFLVPFENLKSINLNVFDIIFE